MEIIMKRMVLLKQNLDIGLKIILFEQKLSLAILHQEFNIIIFGSIRKEIRIHLFATEI